MEVFQEADKVVVYLPKHIDSLNALNIEAEIVKAVLPFEGYNICLDATETNYIASSGLGMLLRLEKKLKNKLSVRNVSPEVYETFSLTGFNEIMKIRKKERVISIEGCEVIGKGAYGTVYRLEQDSVVKVFNMGEGSLPYIEQEQKTARKAFIKGIPTAMPFDVVKVGDQYGVVYETIDAHNFSELIIKDPSSLKKLIPLFVDFLHTIHKLEASKGEFPFAKENYLNRIDELCELLGKDTVAKIRNLIESMPQDLHLVHGDSHFKNIMLSDNEVKVIDMDTLSMGDPVFEFAPLYATYSIFYEIDPTNQTKFLGMDKNLAASIFDQTIKTYLKDKPELLDKAIMKIKLLGYVRYLIIVTIEFSYKDPATLKRIEHAKAEIADLVTKVSDLCMFSDN